MSLSNKGKLADKGGPFVASQLAVSNSSTGQSGNRSFKKHRVTTNKRNKAAVVKFSQQQAFQQEECQIISPRYARSHPSSLPTELYSLQDPAVEAELPSPKDVDPFSLDNRELDKLMSNIGKNKNTWRRVLVLHEWLVAIGHQPDNRLCTTLIRVCSQHGQALTAMSIYDWMRKSKKDGGAGLECSVFTYTAAMRAALGGCLLERALDVWQDCKAAGCEPDARLCTVYIEVCSRLNRSEDALHMYQLMLDAPKDAAMAPTVHAFTTAMRAATEGGRWDKSLEIWKDMEQYGCEPTGHAYAAAISACAAGSRWVKAVHLFEDMISNDIKPDVVSCTALITALATNAEYERGEQVVNWMLKSGVVPNVRTYTALITAMCNAQQWNKAICVIYNMEKQEYGSVAPNAYTYSALLKSLGEHGQWALAEQVFKQLEQEQVDFIADAVGQMGFSSDRQVQLTKQADVQNNSMDQLWSNALAQAIMGQAILNDPSLLQNKEIMQSLSGLQMGSPREAGSCLDLINSFIGLDENTILEIGSKRRNSPVNEVVCGSLMLAYERSGKWQEAVFVLNRARNMGILPNNVMYNTALSAAGKAGQLEIAKELFLEIEEPDVVSYETLIAAYGTTGDIANAEDIFRQMTSNNHKARDYAYCGLIAAYSVAGDLNNALRVRQRMLNNGDKLTVHIYNAMLAACNHCKNLSKALEVFANMTEDAIEPNKVSMDLLQEVEASNKEVESQQLVSAALCALEAMGMTTAASL
eukprot:TRINITY_DN52244_c0_g1_i6.p1 TRINITY_DN52244_c0_g1~~TRINITY_DN52244_c0_g1_i6.p1  ORF type:complete len:753 (-),score=124.34 TRINITY_DN52244_c0_g1_i6:1214-3472(-)